MVLKWHLQVDRWVRPLGEFGVVCVPGALAHWHLAAGSTLPVRVVHTNERSVVRWLIFTGRGGRRSGPGAGGACWGDAVGSAGVKACYSHNLINQERRSAKFVHSHTTDRKRSAQIFIFKNEENSKLNSNMFKMWHVIVSQQRKQANSTSETCLCYLVLHEVQWESSTLMWKLILATLSA